MFSPESSMGFLAKQQDLIVLSRHSRLWKGIEKVNPGQRQCDIGRSAIPLVRSIPEQSDWSFSGDCSACLF